MSRTRVITALAFLLIVLSICCEMDQAAQSTSGEELAARYCSTCHQHVLPEELPPHIWKNVLPSMGHRLGIYPEGFQYDSLFANGFTKEIAESSGLYAADPQLSKQEWKAIETYYADESRNYQPPTVDYDHKASIVNFRVKPALYSRRPPLTTMIKIDSASNTVILADGKQNVNALIYLDGALALQEQFYIQSSPVKMLPWDNGVAILSTGSTIYPHDFANGQLEYVYTSNGSDRNNASKIILDELRRPVDVVLTDRDRDGVQEWIICEFGNHLGSLSMFIPTNEGYVKSLLIDRAGAIKVEAVDLDEDGWQDLVVLMAQGREGLYFIRNDQGVFLEAVPILEFSPLMGSTYFECVDWNGDDNLDILLTAGDNADQSPIVKAHHGIYVFENMGSMLFEQSQFFGLPGAYKAIAADFDGDRQLEVVGISFFPDYRSESPADFVYLDNGETGSLTPYFLKDDYDGRWMVMDVGDLDGDQDLDVVLGSFVRFHPTGDTTGRFERWVKDGPSCILLENKLID